MKRSDDSPPPESRVRAAFLELKHCNKLQTEADFHRLAGVNGAELNSPGVAGDQLVVASAPQPPQPRPLATPNVTAAKPPIRLSPM